MNTASVSVVVPVYRNRATLAELHQRVRSALHDTGRVEIIFVNDACPEGSLEELRTIQASDPGVRVIALERRSGQHQALCAGLRESSGDVVVTMDADLQDPPEAIPSLIAALGGRIEAVYAGRRGRYEPRARLATSWVFKHLIAVISGMPADAGAFMAMTRAVADRAAALASHKPYLTAAVAQIAGEVRSIPVVRASRSSGTSAYSGTMRAGLAARALIQALKWRARGVPQ